MDGRGRGRCCPGRRFRVVLSSEEETKSVAKEFAEKLCPGDVVCLEGDLGAGKTTFVKGIASYFDIEEESVNSPTFIYLQQYGNLAHFDLYRLKNEGEFLALGLDEYFAPPYISCVEWPNILDKTLPRDVYWISLKHHPDGRELVIEKRKM